MRKERVRRGLKRFDVVLTAARYGPDGSRLDRARGFRRHGDVWSDLVLFDRPALLELLEQGRRVVVGEPTHLPGDFEVGGAVRLADGRLVTDRPTGPGDDLGAPLF